MVFEDLRSRWCRRRTVAMRAPAFEENWVFAQVHQAQAAIKDMEADVAPGRSGRPTCGRPGAGRA